MIKPTNAFKALAFLAIPLAIILAYAIGATMLEDGYLTIAPQNRWSRARMPALALAIWNDINDPEITVRTIRGTVILEGLAQTQKERQRAEELATAYTRGYMPLLPRTVTVLNLLYVPPENQRCTAFNAD